MITQICTERIRKIYLLHQYNRLNPYMRRYIFNGCLSFWKKTRGEQKSSVVHHGTKAMTVLYIYIYTRTWNSKQPLWNRCLVKQPFLSFLIRRFGNIQLKQSFILGICSFPYNLIYNTLYTKKISAKPSWWFQPISNILVKLDHFSGIGVKIKNAWNHDIRKFQWFEDENFPYGWAIFKGYASQIVLGETSVQQPEN